MPTDHLAAIESLLAASGGIARIPRLRSAVRHALATAVEAGRFVRLRRGWYALPPVSAEAAAAVRVGGCLSGASSARHYRIWALDDGRLHVDVPRGASRLRKPAASSCILRCSPCAPVVASPLATLLHLVRCQDFDLAVAAVDSALHLGLVSRGQLRIAAEGSARLRRVLDWADGASEAGTESLVRVRLRRLGIRCRIQVRVMDGVRVDILVGDRLVIECDSREFHTGVENYARDRRRDLDLTAAGYLVIRLTYEQVVYGWRDVEPMILKLVRAGRHHWPRRRP